VSDTRTITEDFAKNIRENNTGQTAFFEVKANISGIEHWHIQRPKYTLFAAQSILTVFAIAEAFNPAQVVDMIKIQSDFGLFIDKSNGNHP
jgi:hypothetical protein